MESQIFTARIDRRELASYRDGEFAQVVAHRWHHLNDNLGRYLAENLLASNQFHLLRVTRQTSHAEIDGSTVLTLILDVSQVTERPFVHVAVAADPAAEVRANRAWHDMTGEITGPLTLEEAQPFEDYQEARNRRQPRTFNTAASFEKMQDLRTNKPTPEPTPTRRHILIDKQPQPA